MKRKIIGLGICAVLVVGAVGFSACKAEPENSLYRIEAEYLAEDRTLSAEMTFDYYNDTENALGELKFELWANAFREGAKYVPVSQLYESSAYYKGKNYGGMEILSVEGAESYAVGGEDENILTVTLPSKVYPNESVQIKIVYRVVLAQINHRLGVGENTVSLSGFYPVLCKYGDNGFQEYVYSCYGDPFVNECADFDVTLTVPEEYTAVYAGIGQEVAENGKKTYHVVTENVRDTAFVLGKSFECVKTTACGIDVEYYYYGDLAPELALKAAADSLTYYSKTFGSYEYPRYVVAEADFPYGGMEYSGLSLISSSLRSSEIPVVVAHETAHQWWYAMVGSNQFESAWQDEGLAEFSVALFLDEYPAYGGSYQQMLKSCVSAYRAYYAIYSQTEPKADTSMNRALTSYSGDYEYRNLAYDKGVVLFDSVKNAVGEKKFFSALSRYCEEYKGKIARYEDLVACFPPQAEGVFESFTKGLCVI